MELNKNECWTQLEENTNYEISNFGRVRRKTKYNGFHYIKPFRNSKKKSKLVFVQFISNHKRLKIGLAKLVWKYFGDGNTVGYVKHIDGDPTNNRIDNLYMRREKQQLSKYQIDMFNNYALLNITKIAKHNFSQSIKKYDVDFDDFVQEALIMTWKYLVNYAENEPFYQFCYHYTKYAYFNCIGRILDLRKREVNFCSIHEYMVKKWN